MKTYRTSYGPLRDLVDLLLRVPREMHDTPAIEIGTANGECAVVLSTLFSPLFCVDIMKDPAVEAVWKKNTAGRSIRLFKMTSDAGAVAIQGEFGLVYVDANHTYEHCKADIINYWPKVRVGGVMAGHDYRLQKEAPNLGVIKAVDELFGKPDKVFCDNSWFVLKTPERKLNLFKG